MAKGENIFKRKDGRKKARYIRGYQPSGKIRYRSCCGKNDKEAKERVAKCRAMPLSGRVVPQRDRCHRFAFYCDEWLRSRKSQIRESTYVKYDTMLQKHIKPKLGNLFPLGITTAVMDDFSQELREEGLAAKTVHDILVVLNGILKSTRVTSRTAVLMNRFVKA